MRKTEPVSSASGLSSCTEAAWPGCLKSCVVAQHPREQQHPEPPFGTPRRRGRYPDSTPKQQTWRRRQRRHTVAALLVIVSCLFNVAEASDGFRQDQQRTNILSRAISAVLLRLQKHNNTARVPNATASERMRMKEHRRLQGELNAGFDSIF